VTAEELKDFVLSYLEKLSKDIREKDPKPKPEEVFTNLTFEVISLTTRLLKFGLFEILNEKKKKEGFGNLLNFGHNDGGSE